MYIYNIYKLNFIFGLLVLILGVIINIKSDNIYATNHKDTHEIAFDLKDTTLSTGGVLDVIPKLYGRLRGNYKAPSVGFNFYGKDFKCTFHIVGNFFSTMAAGILANMVGNFSSFGVIVAEGCANNAQ